MEKPTEFYVVYNAKYMARYKTIKGCLNYIKRKGWRDDSDNVLIIWDNRGIIYDSVTGKEV